MSNHRNFQVLTVCFYIYRHDWENNAPVYFFPESITFIKADDAEDVVTPNPGDSEDAEDAETTTPGGSTDSEDAENAGGASDSEDAENAGTTTPPIFSTPDSEDAA